MLSACGGGGSSPDPGFAPVSEIDINYSVSAVHADRAYELGYTGKGVAVAVIDTGITDTAGELSSSLDPASFSVVTNTNDITDTDGHGTAVAGVVAAARDQSGVMGIAYNSRILAIKADTDGGRFRSGHIATAIHYAVGQGAPIINMSIAGSNQPPYSLYQAMDAAVQAGTLLVIASGNGSSPNPEYPARYAGEFGGTGQVIAVGAVDADNRLSSFSSKAGVRKDNFLVAPGENISVLRPDGSVGQENGTSFAAPIVAAAASILKEQAGHLTGREIADILLQTAEDLGAPGVDEVFGHGLLDIAKALEPYGVVVIPSASTATQTPDGGFAPVSTTIVYLDPAFSKAMLKHSALTEVMALDSYGRPYKVDLTAMASRSDPNIDMLTWLQTDTSDLVYASPIDIAGISQLRWGYSQPALNTGTGLVPNRTGGRFALVSTQRKQTKMRASVGLSLNSGLGYNGLTLNGKGLEGRALSQQQAAIGTSTGARHAGMIPYLSYSGQSGSAQVDHSINDLLSFRLAAGTSRALGQKEQALRAQEGFSDPDRDQDQIATLIESSSSTALAGEASFKFSPKFRLSFTAGRLTEQGGFLNSYSDGAFKLADQASTDFAGVTALYQMMPNLQLFGGVTAGQTQVSASNQGVYRNFSSVRSSAYTLGVSRSNLLATRLNSKFGRDLSDRLTLTLSQPLRVDSGSAELNVPIARDDAGNVERLSERVGLAPSGRQVDLFAAYQLGWSGKKGRQAASRNSLSLIGGVTHNPGHDADADAELTVGAKFRRDY